MKIYSWNMLFSNRQQERAFDFIARSDFDIFCLQEAPEEFLTKLQAHFPNVAHAVETSRYFAGEVSTQYLVILSRFPITQSTATPIESGDKNAPGRAKLFVRVMLALRLWGEGRGNRHRLFADIAAPSGAVRVYNLHLPLKYPAWRAEELEGALAARDRTIPTIVCGDFNILEAPHITLLNWVLGGRWSDVVPIARERLDIEKRFVAHEVSNPLRGKSTHFISQSQLDHILVSKDFSVKNATVIPDRYGSDHHPICIETA